MHFIQIPLPRVDIKVQPFERENLDLAKEEIATHFEGVTAYVWLLERGHGENVPTLTSTRASSAR